MSDTEQLRIVLQMAVDYHILSAADFENKYPVRPPEQDNIPCWVSLAQRCLWQISCTNEERHG